MTAPFAPSALTRDPETLFSLKGRTALVTGAAGHLGREIVMALAGAGARVVLNGRRSEPLAALAGDLKRAGHAAEIARFDVRDTEAMSRYFDAEARAGARLDVLVNNAYTGRPACWREATPDDFETAFASGPSAAFNLVKAAEPLMRRAVAETGSASVINIASMYGLISPDPGLYGESGLNSPPHYAAAKGALVQLTRYLACHLAPIGVRVNALAPGPFPRPEIRRTDPAFVERLEAKVPLGRIGEARELRGPLLFLASDAASYVTGATLPVDGGWTAW